MRAWHISQFSIDGLKLTDAIEAPLKSNEVRVKIHACSLNYRDLMVVQGHYNPNQSLPLIPLSDGAGEVVEIGRDVVGFKVGDRVCGTFSQAWCHGPPTVECGKATLGSPLAGMLSESRVFHEEGLIKFPDYLSYEEASTLPCAGVTAFNAIAYQSGLVAGDTVLLLGTGGVSLFALAFAKAFGLKTIITSSSDEKLARAVGMSDDAGVNYSKHPDWPGMVLELTQGKGVDAVIEVGGAKTLERSIMSTKKNGVICVIGVLSGTKEPIDVRQILMNNLRIQGIFVGAKTVFSAMNRVLAHQKIRPVIDRTYDFKDAPKAYSYLESAKHFGKVCIRIG
jgi:NADPH:quinone reductase-like Zn-dependent oxidoreductase